MDKLPDSILDTIYKYKHQMDMSIVFNELMQHKINCRYNNITIEMLQYMYYVDEYSVRWHCIDISCIEVFGHELLNRIKSKKYINCI